MGKIIGQVLTSILGWVLGIFSRKRLERDASRGRAAKEYLKSQADAESEEERQRKAQEKAVEDGVSLDGNDLFDRR